VNCANKDKFWMLAQIKEDTMANTPVEVKQSAPAPAAKPDSLQAFRSEMERLFDRFGFGRRPVPELA
jgi:hypothetical protein